MVLVMLSHGITQPTSSASKCSAGYSDGRMVTATPVRVGTTGQTSYCSDHSGVIRFHPIGIPITGPAPNCAAACAPLQ
jgi:hypothetical protein